MSGREQKDREDLEGVGAGAASSTAPIDRACEVLSVALREKVTFAAWTTQHGTHSRLHLTPQHDHTSETMCLIKVGPDPRDIHHTGLCARCRYAAIQRIRAHGGHGLELARTVRHVEAALDAIKPAPAPALEEADELARLAHLLNERDLGWTASVGAWESARGGATLQHILVQKDSSGAEVATICCATLARTDLTSSTSTRGCKQCAAGARRLLRFDTTPPPPAAIPAAPAPELVQAHAQYLQGTPVAVLAQRLHIGEETLRTRFHKHNLHVHSHRERGEVKREASLAERRGRAYRALRVAASHLPPQQPLTRLAYTTIRNQKALPIIALSTVLEAFPAGTSWLEILKLSGVGTAVLERVEADRRSAATERYEDTVRLHGEYFEGKQTPSAIARELRISQTELLERFLRYELPLLPEDLDRSPAAITEALDVLSEALREHSGKRALSEAHYEQMRATQHPEWPDGAYLCELIGDGSWALARRAGEDHQRIRRLPRPPAL